MEIMVAGLDCKKAPVYVREKLSFAGERLGEALNLLTAKSFIEEAVILSTCNRTEIYLLAEHSFRQELQDQIIEFISHFHQIAVEEFIDYIFIYSGRDAVTHLFEVASGIQSMVVGEAQIQGQVRDAVELGRNYGTVGRVMDAFFRGAISTGKRARTETSISENGVSVSYAAVELLARDCGSLQNRVGLIVGGGQTARLTAQVMLSHGVKELHFANRTPEKVQELVQQLNLENSNIFSLDQLHHAVKHADLIIACTGAPHYLLHHSHVSRIMPERDHRPLRIVDISVPRNIEPAVSEIDNVTLWHIDHIKTLVDENMERRLAEVSRVRGIVVEEVEEFMAWHGALVVVPTITTLRRHADQIRRGELERIRNCFGDLSERQAGLLDELTSRIVNKLLHAPTTRLKQSANGSDAGRYAEVVKYLFALQGASYEAN
jgi:glutamyl-tRNA reductase